eukprot:g8981.t1
MGQRVSRSNHWRRASCTPGTSFVNGAKAETQAEGPSPDIKVQYPISEDIYATFYLLARNATPDMYSISPFKNPDVRIAWLYLLFIAGSQIFVILAITVLYPPSVQSTTTWVNCGNLTAVEALHRTGALASASTADCIEAATPAFEVDLRGETVMMYTLEQSTEFYHQVLATGNLTIFVLRFVCCTWVFSQEVRNSWAICIPLIQYVMLQCITIVSFLVICAFDEPFEAWCSEKDRVLAMLLLIGD